ncbi:MAG: glycosyltransferase family 2 protein [Eubacteriales bacterium]|nr:glycosyltransferase family 2 protein [Eubacteriales bacterium]
MREATVIIPNYNGMVYLENCLESLRGQQCPVIVVDNGSSDGSIAFIKQQYPEVKLICLEKNYGFCRAVNEGIRASSTKYVILLNNDTKVAADFAEKLVEVMEKEKNIFSCQAKMLQMDHPDTIDDAGNLYCALGWAITRGKDAPAGRWCRRDKIFSACAGAAIYRRSIFEEIGYFDEAHFAYLEDVDIGYRARIAGYENWFEPQAVVYHKGSASTGARHNRFKVYHAARNNVYLIYKNMARWQILLNLPLLLAGWILKALFFTCKGMGFSYLRGLWGGVLLARKGEKTPFLAENFDNCWRIQRELWRNLLHFFPR